MFVELDKDVTPTELLHVINQLKLGKSAGNDHLLNGHFSHGKYVLIRKFDQIVKSFTFGGLFSTGLG